MKDVIVQILENKSLIEDPKDNKEILNFQKSIEFKNIIKRYNYENLT